MKKAVFLLLIFVLLLASCAEEVPEHTCSFSSEGEVVLAPNCIENGELLFVCECGSQKTEVIPANSEHDYADGKCTLCGKRKPSEGFSMKLIDKQYYSVSRLGDCTDKDIVIPDTYEGLPVKQIERNAFLRADIESVYIPSSIQTIKASAFAQCKNIQSVYIDDLAAFLSIDFQVDKDNVCKSNPLNGAALYLCGELVTDLVTPAGTPVAPFAFFGCTSIKNLTFSEGTTHIGEYAFAGCSAIETVRFSSTVEKVGIYAFDGCEAIKEVHAASVESWCQIEFWDEKSKVYISTNPICYTNTLLIDGKPVTDIVIPGSVSEIKPFVFHLCNTLTSVTLEEGVRKVGTRAFWDCDSLVTVTLPSTIESIGYAGFLNLNESIETQRINIASVDSFIKATQDTDLIQSNTEIYYGGELLTSVVIPFGIKTLGISFSGYRHLTEIIINGGVEEIVDGALKNTPIESLIVPEGVTKIGAAAFMSCAQLSEVILPKSLETIGEGAFSGCTSLRSLELPEKIDIISEYLFSGCKNLRTLTIHPNIKTINLNAFINSGVKKINYLGTREDWKNVSTRVSSKDYGELKQIDEIIVYVYADESETTKAE
jgi:hypothetical protein